MPELPFGLSVKVLVCDSAGRMLAIQRSRESRFWASKWDLPGGKVDAGEFFDQAMIREAREETNLEIRLDRFIGAIDWDLPHIRLVFLVMRASIVGGELRLSDEHDAYQWLEPGELHKVEWVDPIARVFAQAKLS
jgi:8-oxo-dGTP diphosphatase